MAGKHVSVKIQPKRGSEEAFFAEQDQKKLRDLRKRQPMNRPKNIAKNMSTIVFGVVPKAWLKSTRARSKLTYVSIKIAARFIWIRVSSKKLSKIRSRFQPPKMLSYRCLKNRVFLFAQLFNKQGVMAWN